MACKCSLITLSEGTLWGKPEIWSRIKHWTCLGARVWVGSWEGAWIQLSPESGFHSQEQTWNEIRKGPGWRANPPTVDCPCEAIWELKGKQWLGCGFEWSQCKLLPLWSFQHEVSKTQRKKSTNCLIFHSCWEKKIMKFDWTGCLARGWLLLRNMGQPLRHCLWRPKTGIQSCWVDLILYLRLL